MALRRRGEGAEREIAGAGGSLAGDAAELEARLARAHVALDHLRHDRRVCAPRRRGRRSAVLDDRQRCRRAAEHEARAGGCRAAACRTRAARARERLDGAPRWLRRSSSVVEAGRSAVADGAVSAARRGHGQTRRATSRRRCAGARRGAPTLGCPGPGSTSRVRVADAVAALYGLVLPASPGRSVQTFGRNTACGRCLASSAGTETPRCGRASA